MDQFIEQSVRFEEGVRIYGTYIVSSTDPDYLRELEENGLEIGYVSFNYLVETNQLSFEAVGCQRFAAAHYQQLVETVWAKIRMIQTYWKSDEYQIRKKMEEKAAEAAGRCEDRKK